MPRFQPFYHPISYGIRFTVSKGFRFLWKAIFIMIYPLIMNYTLKVFNGKKFLNRKYCIKDASDSVSVFDEVFTIHNYIK